MIFIVIVNNFLIFYIFIANVYQIFIIIILFFFQSYNSNQYKLNICLHKNIFFIFNYILMYNYIIALFFFDICYDAYKEYENTSFSLIFISIRYDLFFGNLAVHLHFFYQLQDCIDYISDFFQD